MRTLFHLPLDPFCRIIRLVLREKKLDFNLVYERTWDERDEFLSLNPTSEVPVLIDQNGSVIASFYAIIEYLEEAYIENSYIQKSPLQKAEIRRLTDWFNGKFAKEVTNKIVFEKIYKRHFEKLGPDPANLRSAAQNIHGHLDYICYLVDRRRWLAGEEITIADFTAAAHLSCLDFLGAVPWEKYEEAKDWYMRIKSRPSFRPLLSDQVPGHTATSHYTNLDF
jgi:glutathione S-transferase